MPANLNNRVFIGHYPCGVVYADRANEERGDYKRLAFLPYSTLQLEVRAGIEPKLYEFIARDAKTYKQGERCEIAGNMSITLGDALCVVCRNEVAEVDRKFSLDGKTRHTKCAEKKQGELLEVTR